MEGVWVPSSKDVRREYPSMFGAIQTENSTGAGRVNLTLVSPRNEPDRIEILSGVFEGVTLGTPAGIAGAKQRCGSGGLPSIQGFLPSIACRFHHQAKYGVRNWQGGGRASARETVARVAAGAIARQVLSHLTEIEILAWVSAVGDD